MRRAEPPQPAQEAFEPRPDPDLLLSLDGGTIVIRSADVAPFEQYFEALDATMGVKYRFRALLEQHLIPTAREFVTEIDGPVNKSSATYTIHCLLSANGGLTWTPRVSGSA